MRACTRQPQDISRLDLSSPFAKSGSLVMVPGVSPRSADGKYTITGPRTVAPDAVGVGLTSAHTFQIKGSTRTASTGTVVLVFSPAYQWGAYPLCFERLWGYSSQSMAFRYNSTEIELVALGTAYSLTNVGVLSLNTPFVLAVAHDGAEYRTAWSTGTRRGFKTLSGALWFDSVPWDGGTSDLCSVGASFSSGSPFGLVGWLDLVAYAPDYVASTAELHALRDNPWQIFSEQPRWLYTGMGSGSWTPLEVQG